MLLYRQSLKSRSECGAIRTKHKLSPLSLCGAKTVNDNWEESVPQEHDWPLLSFRHEPWTSPTMLSFCAPALCGVAESIRISGGFCNFGHEWPWCRMTCRKQLEQFLGVGKWMETLWIDNVSECQNRKLFFFTFKHLVQIKRGLQSHDFFFDFSFVLGL